MQWSITTSNAEIIKWFSPTEDGPLDGNDEFQIRTSGPKECEKHILIFGEVYPDDSGEYRVEISLDGETKTTSANLNGEYN